MDTFFRFLRPAVVCFVAVATLASVAVADTVTLSHNSGGHVGTTSGGQFMISHTGSMFGEFGVPFTPTGLSGDLANTFSTFCLEKGELVSIGGVYNYSVDQFAKAGGGGAVGGKDFLDTKTAWLYKQFITGTLGALTGGVYAYNDNASADALQNVIWHLEGEGSLDAGLATELFGLTSAADGSLYDVRVLNLYDASGNNKQSQLIFGAGIGVPAPAAGILAFLGLGLLGWYRRRSAA